MEQSCNVFGHGEWSGTRIEILLIWLLSLSHQATTLGQERWIKLLILAFSCFKQLKIILCSCEEINGMCDLASLGRRDMF